MAELVGGQGDKQYGDMGDGAMVPDTVETTDTRLLDGNGQETAEYALDGRASVVFSIYCIPFMIRNNICPARISQDTSVKLL